MKRQGEITEIRNHIATVRIYKNDEPTALTVNARFRGDFSVTDMVNLEINTIPFRLYVTFAYLLPFITVFLGVKISGVFTQNIIIREIIVLSTLLLTYLGAKRFEKTEFFEKVTFCRITGLAE